MSAAPSGIVLYYSSVAGSVAADKNTDRARFLLTAAKLPFSEIDISLSENTAAKEYMKANSLAENKSVIPQIFLNGTFKGTTDVIDEWNEFGELKENLNPQ